MKIEIKKILWPSLVSSLVILILGFLLVFQSEVTLMTISYIIGAILFAIGIIAMIRFFTNKSEDSFSQLNIVYGIICILAGIFFVKEPKMIGSIIPVVLGIGIIINSSIKVQQALVLRNVKNKYWTISLVISLLSLVCGVVLLFNPFSGAVVLTKIIGIFLILYAVLDLVNTFLLKKSNGIQIEIEKKEVSNSAHAKDAKIVKEIKHREEKEK
ncbi:MAG TPA: DUF308 domain-containing protein [Candidatus Onthousia faecigallinarum]|nr:DUF308 domain-containing protein [Candidatus Onthousia faecigallinarum]